MKDNMGGGGNYLTGGIGTRGMKKWKGLQRGGITRDHSEGIIEES